MDLIEYERAQAIDRGELKQLYMAGHHHKKGYAVALEFVDAPIVLFYASNPRAIVERFNRLQLRRWCKQ